MRALMVVVLVGAALAAACASEPSPASPALTAAETTVATPTTPLTVSAATTVSEPAVQPEGFERVRATVTEAGGEVCELCLWLAADADQRRRGLMFVTDLGDADGMVFRYDTPQTGSFWMKNTLLPLSIAFFDAAGAYLGAFDMKPCTADPCATYPTSPDFTFAIETTQGNLAALGIAEGSTLAVTDLPCP
jgi:uncharacterized protein